MPESRNKLVLAAIACFALLNVFVFIRDGLMDTRPRIDFYGFYAGSAKLRAGESPFPGEVVSKTAAYINPQAWAFALEPLTFLERDKAAGLWWSVSMLLLVGTIAAGTRYGITRGVGGEGQPGIKGGVVVAFAAGLGFTPALFGWNIGQSEILLAAILGLILVVPDRHRSVCAGVCVGLATLFKVSPVMLAPALALAFGLRFVAAFLSVVVVYIGILLVTGTFGRELELFTRVVPQLQFTTGHPDSSIYRLVLAEWFGGQFLKPDGSYGGRAARGIEIGILLLYAAACWLLRKRNADWFAYLAAGIAFSHLASPFIEPHHFTNTLLVFVPWVVLFVVRRDWVPVAFLGGIWFIGVNFQRWHSTAGAGWPGYVLFVTDLLLLVLAFLRPRGTMAFTGDAHREP